MSPDAAAGSTHLLPAQDPLATRYDATGWKLPSWISRGLDYLALLCEWIIVAALTFDLALTLTATILRYFSAGSIIWFDEAVSISLNMIAFLGGAVAFRRMNFLAFTYFQDRASPRVAAVLRATSLWTTVLVCSTVLYEWPGFFRPAQAIEFPNLHISQAWGAIWIGIGMAVLLIFVAEQLVQVRPAPLAGSFAVVAGVLALLLAWRHFDARDISTSRPLIPVLVVLLLALFAGTSIPFVLILGGLVYFFVTSSPAIIGLPNTMEQGISNFILLAIPFFVLAGVLMEVTGMSARLVELVEAWIGRMPGGLLQTEIAGVYIFSGLSGSKAADMAAVGGALKGPLQERGYPPEEAVSVLAASAVMGVTVPPSINLIIVGSITAVSMSSLFVAGMIPAAVLAIALMVAVAIRARLQGIPRGDHFTFRRAISRVPSALPALLLPVIMVGGIVGGFATATEASSLAVAYGFLVTLVFYRSVGLRATIRLVRDACVTSALILFLLSGASVFGQTIVRLNVPGLLTDLFTSLGGKLSFLIITALGLIVVGCLTEGVPALFIFAPILIPLSQQVGIDPLQFAIILVVAIEMGAFLPPLGAGLYVACAIMGVPVARAVRPMLFYWLVLLVGLAFVIAIPQITVALPHAFGFK